MIEGKAVLCSWSGGKDAALALHEAEQAGFEPRCLVTMLTEGGERSRSHGLARAVLEAQAEALGLPILFGAATWDGYEAEMVRLLGEAVAAHSVGAAVFGDIETDGHREWVERVSAAVGIEAVLPLWHRDPRQLVTEQLGAGFEPVLIAVRDGVLPAELLGRTLDAELVDAIAATGADPAGENGEFHTVVTDGPNFARPVALTLGPRTLRDGVWFSDAAV